MNTIVIELTNEEANYINEHCAFIAKALAYAKSPTAIGKINARICTGINAKIKSAYATRINASLQDNDQ